MSTVSEIALAIERLPTDQMLELATWLDDYRAMVQASEGLFEMLDAAETDTAGRQWQGS